MSDRYLGFANSNLGLVVEEPVRRPRPPPLGR